MAKPERPPTNENGILSPAVKWVQERGGCAACAHDVLVMTLGKSRPIDVRMALEKAGAPPMVFGLIWRDIYHEAARKVSNE